MPSSSRTNRFQSFTPLRSTTGSLRRLKTAFSPVRSQRSTSPDSTSSITSPLTRNSSPRSQRSTSSYNTGDSIRHLLAMRQKSSSFTSEMEEEKHLFENELNVLEPRPSLGFGGFGGSEVHVAGIFEVLDGKC